MDSHDVAPRPNRRGLYLALAAVAAWGIYLAFAAPQMSGRRLGPPALSAPARTTQANYQWSLTDLEGRKVDFGEFRGRTVFLNIWASWCPPCQAEMPSIVNLAQNPEMKDVSFVLVGSGDSPAALRKFVESSPGMLQAPLRLLVASESNPSFETEGIPATFVIAPDGTVALEHVGAAQWDSPEVVRFLAGIKAPASTQ